MKNALEAHFPGCFIPVLPDKHFRVFIIILYIQKNKEVYIASRVRIFDYFCKEIALRKHLYRSSIF